MCGKLTGWNLQSRSGTKCFAVYPIFFYLHIASTGNFDKLRGIRLAEFLLSENCRILHTTVSRVFSHNSHRFSTYHPYGSILLNVIQTCINLYSIEVHGPPTHQPHNFAKSFPPWSVGSSSDKLCSVLGKCFFYLSWLIFMLSCCDYCKKLCFLCFGVQK